MGDETPANFYSSQQYFCLNLIGGPVPTDIGVQLSYMESKSRSRVNELLFLLLSRAFGPICSVVLHVHVAKRIDWLFPFSSHSHLI